MAFFEEIGKRLTDAGTDTARKAKNFTEAARLGSVVSDKEKEIVKLYTAIGEAYYNAHKDDPAAECLEQVGQISGLLGEIAQHQEEIKQLRGVVKCPTCGAEVPVNAAFCNACGAKMEVTAAPAPEAEEIKCPQCGGMISKGNNFCNHCGAKLGE